MEGHPRRSVRWSGRALLSWIALSALAAVAAQENAGMTIPSSLVECYSNASLLSHAALPTFGIGQLIDLIRKVENNQYIPMDLKTLAVQLTQRFRQDGIRRAPDVTPSDGVVPFTPSGPEFFRHMILLTKLIPGNAYNFPNSSLSMPEQCALHFMMSSTMDDINRGANDDQPCNNLKNYPSDPYGNSGTFSGYQSGYGGGGYGGFGGGYSSGVNYNSRRGPPTRAPRRSRNASPGIEDDVEILDPNLQAAATEKAGKSTNYVRSRCPVQSGVVLTPWGSVSGGTVIAAIAAGLVPQTVQGEMLAAAFPRSRYYTPRRNSADTMGAIDNRWAATFSGDLAQVALLQGASDRNNMAVGTAGGWSSAFEPKQYYITPQNLNRQTDGSMTDPMVRGSMDGLIMASYVSEWYSRTSNSLKLSQLLDMYYSERGVFDRNTRACSRRERFGDVATTQTLNAQTEAFSKFYGRNNPISVTMTDDVISDLADTAVSKLQLYIPTASAPACEVTSTGLLARPYANLLVLLDTAWQYTDIHPAISFLLDRTEAGQFGSKVTILNAMDGSVLFNSTYPRLDWHVAYTSDAHSDAAMTATGFDMLSSLGAAMQRLRTHDADNHDRRVLGGRGQAVLFVPQQNKGVDQNKLWERMTNYRMLYPDVDLLVLASRNINRNAFSAFTNDTNNDVFSLEPTDPYNSMSQLVNRIKRVPRRLRNPNCDPDWREDRSGNSEFVDYVEPLGVNYYRLAPNNFYRTTDTQAKLRVTMNQGLGTLTVCYSRSFPSLNGTSSNIGSQATSAGTCSQVGNNGLEIPIVNLCPDAYFVRDCAPLYLAVSAAQSTTGASTRCQDQNACRFPDMVRYSVILERAGCWSSASGLQAVGVLATLLVALSSVLLH
ncbi:uncharacterized protein LOC117652324 [Thrips palmi]|uniref:Uncharacterized protein LOC117652324 n=1 Tax=Thrips palmi TaxID=161013 RepID=A0A6P9A681_THRPL|nr:uncharacterized protein LOC117652324 [Thrips palmi]